MANIVSETADRVRELKVDCRERLRPYYRWSWLWLFRRNQEQWEALLSSPSHERRELALAWLLVENEHVRPEEGLQLELARITSNGSVRERRLASAVLRELGWRLSEAPVNAIISNLNDTDSLVREILTCALIGNGAMAIPGLVSVVLNGRVARMRGAEPNGNLREQAMRALVLTVEKWDDAFRTRLNPNRRDDEEAREMQDEFWRPLQEGCQSNLALLSSLLEDRISPRRLDAAYCLALFGSDFEAAIKTLAGISQEIEPTVELVERWNAICRIHGAKAAAGIPALRNCMRAGELKLRERAADAIGQMGEAALPTLIDCLRDEHPICRAQAALTLSRKMGFPSNLYRKCGPAVPTLRQMLTDADPGVRDAAAEALRIAELCPQEGEEHV